MEKFDSKKYIDWCKEHKVDASDEESLKTYNKELKEKEEQELKAKKLKDIKEIFDLMVKFTGKDVKFDERAASFLEEMYQNLVKTVGIGTNIIDMANEIAKLGE